MKRSLKKLNSKYVSASDQGGEYFQITFEEEKDSLINYFLIQRSLNEEDDIPDPPYIESDDMRFCGHIKLLHVELNRNRFFIQLAEKGNDKLEINFTTSDKNYDKIKEILEIILFDCKCKVIK